MAFSLRQQGISFFLCDGFGAERQNRRSFIVKYRSAEG